MKTPAKIEHLACKYLVISLIHSLIHLTCICSTNHCAPGPGDPRMSEGEIPPRREGSGIQKIFLEEVIPSGIQGVNNSPWGEPGEAESMSQTDGTSWQTVSSQS